MNWLLIDCDSTLSALEGIDELGRLRGQEIFEKVEAITHDAMNGTIPLDGVFSRRLELIQPNQEEASSIGQKYIDHALPAVRETLETLREKGWHLGIISGGFEPCIRPFAHWLGICDVHAVPLYFDANGAYAGYGESYPTTRNGGKTEIIEQLKQEAKEKGLVIGKVVMMGDGISDLETAGAVDHFIGFGGVVTRPKVQAQATSFVMSWAEVPAILDTL